MEWPNIAIRSNEKQNTACCTYATLSIVPHDKQTRQYLKELVDLAHYILLKQMDGLGMPVQHAPRTSTLS
jgi:hypothetical protein